MPWRYPGLALRSEAREILGLPAVYRPADLDAAFRRQARAAHPDHSGDPATFVAVAEAYWLLAHSTRMASNVAFADDRGRLARLATKLRRRSGRRLNIR